jgi:hypothetical protein
MVTINPNENLIRITPPITWDEIQDVPALTALEMVFRTVPDGREAVGIRLAAGGRIDSYLDRELQKVVNHYTGHTFAGHIEIRYERPQGAAAHRVLVRGPHVMRVEAVLGWPSEPDTDPAEESLMDILASVGDGGAYVNLCAGDFDRPTMRPADETDLPDLLLAWKDAAVQAALDGLGLKDEYGVLRYRENEYQPNVIPPENAALAIELRPQGVLGPDGLWPGRLMRHKVTGWEEIPGDVTPDDIDPGYSERKSAAAREAEDR